MPNVIRNRDESDHGGYIESSQTQVEIAGKMVCVNEDYHVCPIFGHGRKKVIATGETQIDGRKIVVEGDEAECGAKMIASFTKVSTN